MRTVGWSGLMLLIAAALQSGALAQTAKQTQEWNSDCASCHSTPSAFAAFLMADGKYPITADLMATATTGTSPGVGTTMVTFAGNNDPAVIADVIAVVTAAGAAAPAPATTAVPIVVTNTMQPIVITDTPLVFAEVPVTVSHHALRFGNQTVGQSSPAQDLRLVNTTPQAVTLTSFKVSSGDADFVLGGGSCVQGGALAAGATCAIPITFTPQSVGSRAGTLTIVDTSGLASRTIALEGVGTSVNGPAATMSMLSLEFDDAALGQITAPKVLTIANPDGGPVLAINGITIEGPNATDFSATTTCLPTLAAGGTCSISLTYQPTAQLATNVGLLTVNSSSMGALATVLIGRSGAAATTTATAPTATTTATTPTGATTSGTATTGTTTTSTSSTDTTPGAATTASTSGAVVTPSTSALTFAPIAMGTSSGDLEIVLTNTGTQPATVGNLSLSAAGFAISSDTCSGSTLAPAATCAVTVRFTPTAVGATSGQLIVPTVGNATPTSAAVSVTGTAVAPATSPSATSTTASASMGGGGAVDGWFIVVAAAGLLFRRRGRAVQP